MSNFPTIQLNENAALKANTGGGSFFDGNTEQLVKIVRAEYITAQNKGTTGITFDVYNKDDQKGYFTLWITRANGEFIEGFYNLLQSIMSSTGVSTLTPTNATIDKWDADAGKSVPTQMVVANELMNKHFTGLFLSNFEVYNGEKKVKTELFAAFNQKRQSLQEQRDQAQPKQIDAQKERMIAYSVKSEKKVDDDLKGSSAGGYNNQMNNSSQPQSQSTSYQRSAPPQHNNNQGGQQNNAPAANNHSPLDDGSDIPF